nr:ribonuclease H-like domain-containing protein [Tanacetum cinerariifolium]
MHLLHMDLCGPMRVSSINGKKYILVIVDDYSHYSWTLFPRSKDETPKSSKRFSHDDSTESSSLGSSSVNNSSSPTENSAQKDTQPSTNIHPTSKSTTPTNVNAEENNDTQSEDTQFQQDEFINPFCIPVREVAESSSHNIDNSNMHTFNQPQDSEYQWTKDHPLS